MDLDVLEEADVASAEILEKIEEELPERGDHALFEQSNGIIRARKYGALGSIEGFTELLAQKLEQYRPTLEAVYQAYSLPLQQQSQNVSLP